MVTCKFLTGTRLKFPYYLKILQLQPKKFIKNVKTKEKIKFSNGYS